MKFNINELRKLSDKYRVIQENRGFKAACRYINRKIKWAAREGSSHAHIHYDFEHNVDNVKVALRLKKHYEDLGFQVYIHSNEIYDISLNISWGH